MQSDKTRDRTFVDKTIARVRNNVDEDLCEQCWGAVLFDLGHHEEGIAHLKLAVELHPSGIKNRLVLADRLRRQGNDQSNREALKWYENLLASESDYAKEQAYCGLAHWFLDIDPSRSLKNALCAIELNPYDADLRYLAGCGLTECGRQADAIEQFQAAIELKYDEVEHAFGAIAECFRDLGERDNAVAYARLAREANPWSDYAKDLCAELGCGE